MRLYPIDAPLARESTETFSEEHRFQFGPGDPEMSFECRAIPVGVAGVPMQLRIQRGSPPVPTLGSRALLSHPGALIGLRGQMVVFAALSPHLLQAGRLVCTQTL